jgi:hypothetical protein
MYNISLIRIVTMNPPQDNVYTLIKKKTDSGLGLGVRARRISGRSTGA